MSALPPKADIADRGCHVRFVPKADITLSRVVVLLRGVTSVSVAPTAP
jgi:hypothetical protein